MNSIGFGPRSSQKRFLGSAAATESGRSISAASTGSNRRTKGIRHSRNRPALVHLLDITLIVLAQIHEGVHSGDLVAVAVELYGLVLRELAQPLLARLAPA